MTLTFVVKKRCPGMGAGVCSEKRNTAPAVFLGRAGQDSFSGGSGRIVPLRNALGEAAQGYKSKKKVVARPAGVSAREGYALRTRCVGGGGQLRDLGAR